MEIKNSIEIEIPFYDMDSMCVVWHGNYIKYLEEARCALLERLGYTYFDMDKENRIYPVAKLEIKYIKPCIFQQKIIVTAILKEYDSCLIIDYDIKDKETSEKILKAQTMQICVDKNTKTTIYAASQKLLDGVKNYV